ncbi:pyrimidine reductase family protein [Nocardia brasiliensis]|uniref:pyrimidine reductase family protein n=1 Tax=Nocardia brasiliensis TaxID=37326 RepID=UPI002456B75C|nr:pyrimidine reductase family protein [Nocardia brasiliensis]
MIDLYEYESGESPWIKANFVVSVDGAIAANGGTSGALTSPLDQQVLRLLRELSDVVLVGASTIRAEDYIGIRVSDAGQERRRARGMAPTPPIAVVTGRADLDPNARIFTNTSVPPIILTTTTASTTAKRNLETAGAHVVELGAHSITTTAIVDTLSSFGHRRIVTEGGPTLVGQLAADHALDELCITTAPTVLSGTSVRLTHSERPASLAMDCKHIIFDADGAQLARWVRRKNSWVPNATRY